MSNSTAIWLPVFALAMLCRELRQQATRLPLRAIVAPSSSSAQGLHQSFPRRARHHSIKVPARISLDHDLSPTEYATFKSLLSNQQLFTKSLPAVAENIVQEVAKKLDEHKIRDTEMIMNEPPTKKNPWAVLQKLSAEFERRRATLNEAEMHKAMGRIKGFTKKFWKPTGAERCIKKVDAKHRTKAVEALYADRNELAHKLEVEPCIDSIMVLDGIFETYFDALFGLPSVEATTLIEFDEEKKFHVIPILELHARLWKFGIGRDFIPLFHQWLEAMRSLQSKQGLNEADVDVISIEKLAAETVRSGKEDVERVPTSYTGGRKGAYRFTNWESVVEDWKSRGVWEKVEHGWQTNTL